MDKFFSVFGKLVLVLLVLGLVGGAAYYFGNKNSQIKQSHTTVSPTLQPTKENITVLPTTEETVMPTASNASRTAFSAGVPQFGLYVLSYPAGWTPSEQRDDNAGIDTVTFTKNGYILKIVQAGTGGGACIFGNEAPQPFSQHFNTYVEISGANNMHYRRGQTDDTHYTICEKTSDGSYKFPTSWGPITYVTQVPTVSSILAEMDSIVASISKQH